MRRRALRVVVAAAPAALLTACGFQLRQAPVFAFRRVALTGFAPRSPLADELKAQLLRSGLAVDDNPAQAEVVLQALSDQRERRVVATTTAAQVREVQLRLRLRWRTHTPAGRELRLRQEYFLVSASVQDMVARHLRESGHASERGQGGAIRSFGRANAVHLNDTHPALAPAERSSTLPSNARTSAALGSGLSQVTVARSRGRAGKGPSPLPCGVSSWGKGLGSARVSLRSGVHRMCCWPRTFTSSVRWLASVKLKRASR